MTALGRFSEYHEIESLKNECVLSQAWMVFGDNTINPLRIDDSKSGLGRFIGAIVAHDNYMLRTVLTRSSRQINNVKAFLSQFCFGLFLRYRREFVQRDGVQFAQSGVFAFFLHLNWCLILVLVWSGDCLAFCWLLLKRPVLNNDAGSNLLLSRVS